MKDRRLGLGLDALLGGVDTEPSPVPVLADPAPRPAGPPTEAGLDELCPNPHNPRTVFDEEDLRSLAESIRETGVLQPVVVRLKAGRMEIVAGERRWRAAKIAGLPRVPVAVRNVDDAQMLRIALVENLQRKDLNPIEKARAFRELMQSNDWTQDQAAQAVGMARASVANFLRLLELPADVQEALARGAITMGHARALLGTSNVATRLLLLKKILTDDLSVRATEKLVSYQPSAKTRPPAKAKDPYLADVEQKLGQHFGTKVEIASRGKGGTLTLSWYSNAHFAELMRKIGVSPS